MAEPLAPPPEPLVVPSYGSEEPGVAPPPESMEIEAGAQLGGTAVKPTVLIAGKRMDMKSLKLIMAAAGLGAVLCVVL
jgi:hypothetical protein